MQQFINTTVESMERTMQNTSEAAEESANVEDLLMVKEFLSNSYELRNNVVAGRLEFRRRDGTDSPFRQLTCEAENSIILDAMQTLGMLKGLKNMLTLLLHSNEVAEYDPVREYLTNLPRWDGQNRVAELFGRLPGISSENIYRCSICQILN